jgi:hypothetical protein
LLGIVTADSVGIWQKHLVWRHNVPVTDATDSPAPEAELPAVPQPARRRRITVERVVISSGIAIGLLLVWIGLNAGTTGRDALRYPDAIIDISPAPNDRQVLSQTEILVDLMDGYEAVLVLDDIELPVTRLEDVAGLGVEPGQQIESPPTAIYDQGNSLIRFEPREGAPIERYGVGVHQAKVIFWKIELGRNAARSYSWSFEVL